MWDIHGDHVDYDFDIPQGPRTPDTLWQFYNACIASAQRILASYDRKRRFHGPYGIIARSTVTVRRWQHLALRWRAWATRRGSNGSMR